MDDGPGETYGSTPPTEAVRTAPSTTPTPWRGPVPSAPATRPRIVDESAILGLSRVSRGRLGSRLFIAFFVFVFVLIAVQMVVALLTY